MKQMKMMCIVIASAAFALSSQAADPSKKGDVILEKKGINHIGMYRGSDKVLEVLNDSSGLKNGSKGTCVHNDRTLDEFKTSKPSKYFKGAKYVSGLSSSTLAKILDTMKNQYLFNARYSLTTPSLTFRCQAYNSTSLYCWDRDLNKKQYGGDSVLRCDYAVASAYYDVTGKIYGWSGIPTPEKVFDAFPKTR